METKSFEELRRQMSLERRAENKRQTQFALLHLKLSELRKSLNLTQD